MATNAVHRRSFLQALLPCAVASCRRPATPEAVLAAIVQDLMVSDVEALVATSRRLEASTGDLARAPSEQNLSDVRARWREATMAWKRASCLRHGPLVETSALLRALYWPPRKGATFGIAAAKLDLHGVDELGVDQKGLFAIERLVFARAAGAPASASSPDGDRARQLTAALASNVTRCAENAARSLGDGTAYAATFAARGQESTSLLVNQMVDIVEAASGHLARVAGSHTAQGRDVEGVLSRTELEIPLWLLSGTERVYLGGRRGGLGALVKLGAPAIDEHVRAAFAKALATVRAIAEAPRTSRPDADPSDEEGLGRAARAVKELEVTAKTDLASALGVTLTFAGPDAD
ncbi:MAG TPA: imelysin family protein [Polyangiaceae bacterium]|nr:imelysin family protein [Polyangiaceae bacterium]